MVWFQLPLGNGLVMVSRRRNLFLSQGTGAIDSIYQSLHQLDGIAYRGNPPWLSLGGYSPLDSIGNLVIGTLCLNLQILGLSNNINLYFFIRVDVRRDTTSSMMRNYCP